MSRDNREESVTQKSLESEQLLAQKIQSRSIKVHIEPVHIKPAKRRPQSLGLFDMGESTQEIKVDPESAPAFSQNSERRNETPAQCQGQQTDILYSDAQHWAQNDICNSTIRDANATDRLSKHEQITS